MFNLEKKFVLERLSLERRRNGYCETMMGLSMGISDEIEVATIVIDETIKSGNRECSLPADVLWGCHAFISNAWQTNPKGRLRGGYREWCDGGKGNCQKEWNVQSFSFAF